MKTIKEGKATIKAEIKKIVNKKMVVFYNPVMVVNRDFSLLVIEANNEELVVGDVLAGSGVRSIRTLKEVTPKLIKKIIVNDTKENFKKNFEENLALNELKKTKTTIKNEDANKVLQANKFDYVEIDPFGTPNPFLDNAIRALNREGILSVTATDTSSLCGSYPKACKRKYWAEPLRNELMHEFATRILIRKIQLLGAQHEKALTPLLSYASDHYVKVFLKATNKKKDVDTLIKKHEYYEGKGPIYTGEIQNEEFIKKMMEATKKIDTNTKTKKILTTIQEEAKIKEPFFYDLHKEASRQKTKNIPRQEEVIQTLKQKGYDATKTHFNENAIKTNAEKKEFIKIFKELTS